MTDRTDRTNDLATSARTATAQRERRARRAGWLVAAAAASLLVATPVLAHGGAWGSGRDAARQAAPMGAMHGYGMHLGAADTMLPGMLQRLPLGTEVTVTTFAGDPAEGAEPTATLQAVVGETSEVAFAEQLASASAEATHLTVEVGPRTERIDLAAVDGARAPMGRLGVSRGALAMGDTIEVAVFAAADDADPVTTLSFTYGEDSEAGFRAELADAAANAAAIEVTHPAHIRTIDLSAPRFAAADGAVDGADGRGAFGPGRGMPGGGARGMGMPGRGTR